eukprot:scaffold517_cov119-Cylindrotheca_fusiformis.AAC.10
MPAKIGCVNEPDGMLDALLNSEGPYFATIKTVSPEKTVSTVTHSPSPKSVSQELFQASGAHIATQPMIHREQRDLAAAETDSNMLRIDVESIAEIFTFYVPISQMLQREREMREAFNKASLAPEHWTGSRLYSLWKKERSLQDDVAIACGKASSNISITLSPETDMRAYSAFQWKPWLTTCVREFYKTGTVRIPDDCLGSELLITLEYLRIITPSPKVFIFESPHSFERIRAWSAYFTQRRTLLDWMVRDYRKGGYGIRTYTTAFDSQDGSNDVLLQVKGILVDILGQSRDDSRLLYKTAHSLFRENDSDRELTKQVPRKIRHDFRDQLLRFLPEKTRISFELHRVSVTKKGRTKEQIRPVLRIEGPYPSNRKRNHVSSQDMDVSKESNRRPIRTVSISPPRNQMPLRNPDEQTHTRKEPVGPRTATGKPIGESSRSNPNHLPPKRIRPQQEINTTEELHTHGKNTPRSTRRPIPTQVPPKPLRPQQEIHTIEESPVLENATPRSTRPNPNQLPRNIVHDDHVDTVEQLQGPQTAAAVKPLSIVNMDQSSVTSGLSYSMMGDSAMGLINNNAELVYNKQMEKRKQQQQAHRTTLQKTPLPSAKQALRRRAFTENKSDCGSRAISASESTISARTDGKISRKGRNTTPSGTFESIFLAICNRGVAFCDFSSTLPSSRGGSASPIREISFANSNDQSTLLSYVSEDETRSQARNTEAVSSPNKDSRAGVSEELTDLGNAINAVKAAGDSLYKQVDDAMLWALDPESSQQRLEN